ncbi:MAG: hypothetical protein ACYDH5_18460, partial [Acidimicrobiales bacterium]
LTHSSSSINALHNYQNYISRQVAGLWFPTGDNQISVVKNTLQGWQPQQAFGSPRASRWYLTG